MLTQIEQESEARRKWRYSDTSKLLQGLLQIGFVILEGRQVIGYAITKVDESDLEVLRLTIRPGYRRRGLGRMLVQKLVGLARVLKRENLSVALNEWEVDLTKGPLPFLLAVGFKGRGVRRGKDGEDDCFLLKIRLAPERIKIPLMTEQVPA